MTKKEKYSTGTPSERRVGYSRAIKMGENRLIFSGTTAQDAEGKVVGDNVYEQASYIFDKNLKVAREAGFTPEDLVMVRAYLMKLRNEEDFDRAFHERFSDINPACTLINVVPSSNKGLLIEIETHFEK